MHESVSRFSPQIELDVLELWVEDIARAMEVLAKKFGFVVNETEADHPAGELVAYLTAGRANLLLRQGLDAGSSIRSYVARHGDSIADVALVCEESDALVDRALAHGVKVTNEGGHPQIDLFGDGTIVHTIRDRRRATSASPRSELHGLEIRSIDHITYCVPFGTLDRIAQIYSEVFEFEPIPVKSFREVGDSGGGMRSGVLRAPQGFSIVITEPMSAGSVGQTQRFLDAHKGAGVQHVAFAYYDLVEAVRQLRSRGVEFFPILNEHLQQSYERLDDRDLPWEDLRRGGILVDSDENGLLLQLFALPIFSTSSFFIELIQREGSKGFGGNNVRALFAAVDAAIKDPGKMLWRTEEKVRSDPKEWAAALTRTARNKVPFYEDHLTNANTLSLLALPTFDKSKTAGYGQFPLSADGGRRAHRVFATSGTSGDRLYFGFDEDEWNRTGNWLEKVGRRVGLTTDDVLLNTHCYGLWVGGPALDLLANRAGAGLAPLGPIAPNLILRLLDEGVGTAISATPSYMCRLIEAAETAGFDLRKTPLRFGFIGAEPAEQSLRSKLLSQLPLNFRWIELYGLTETAGPSVAFAPDPAVPELELNTEDYWLEVLERDADKPVAAGEVGELTITTRAINGRTPLVRYRTHDFVRVAAGEPEAPTRISRILGRTDHSLKIGGVLVYPSAIAEIMSQFIPTTAEWRALVVRREFDDELILEVEASPAVCDEVKVAFQSRIGVRPVVTSAEPGSLARSREKTQRILVDSSTKEATPMVRKAASN